MNVRNLLLAALGCALLASAPLRLAADDPPPRELLLRAKRILFLGDSITYAGEYVAHFDAWLAAMRLPGPPVVIDAGLPSETVSGLSEEGHAGGKFPRPDLAERLTRVLETTRPDLVIACYGINCGIYQPLDEERFAKYRAGLARLKAAVEQRGATFIAMTPPSYDDRRAKLNFSYNGVLDAYSDWIVAQRATGWRVIDLHGPMTRELAARRADKPDFTFQPDAVHPNAAGHWFIAQQVIGWFGDQRAAESATADEFFAALKVLPEARKKVAARLYLRRDAYLSAAGHKRPGVAKGLPVDEAEQQAAALTADIEGLLDSK